MKRISSALMILAAAALPAVADGPDFTDDVTISVPSPDILLIDTNNGEADWELCVDDTGCPGNDDFNEAFHISWVDDLEGPQIPFIIEHNTRSFLLYLDSAERIGIGTSTPAVELHIPSVSPEIRLDDTSIGGGTVDLSLSGSSFAMEGTSSQNIIAFDTDAPATMDIDSLGTTVFFGDLQVNSSRAAKEGIEEVDGREVLARLKELPIHRWSYKKDGEMARHMGPMAEDFHAAFGLGQTDQHISVIDSAGVALAAVQALALRVESLERENGKLRNKLRQVQSSLLGRRAEAEPPERELSDP